MSEERGGGGLLGGERECVMRVSVPALTVVLLCICYCLIKLSCVQVVEYALKYIVKFNTVLFVIATSTVHYMYCSLGLVLFERDINYHYLIMHYNYIWKCPCDSDVNIKIPASALQTTRRCEGGHVARTNTFEGHTLWRDT